MQDKIIEEISDKQYEEFIATMDRLLAHPYSYKCKDFILNYRHVLRSQSEDRSIIEPKVGEDGRQYVTTYGNYLPILLQILIRNEYKSKLFINI